MTAIRFAELCAGYGGLGLGLARAGLPVDLAWYAENDPDAGAVMAKHHLGIANLGDITEADWARAEPVDILAAGYPCQSFSNAGKRKGWDDERAIWPHVADAIRQLRPRIVCLENVSAHLVRGFPDVLGDLAEIGYDAQWTCLRASDVGAAHQRDRLFCLAYPADTDSSTVRGLAVGDGTRRPPAIAGDDREGLGGLGLLPTPTAREMHGASRAGREGGANLRTAVAEALLPTPTTRDATRGAGRTDEEGRPLSETVMRLLPTPRATDGTKGGPNQRGSAGDLMLPSAVAQLLPTPTVADSRNATAERRTPPGENTNHSGWTLCDVAHAGRWGRYTGAIERWERITGRAAPEPTEPGKRGGPRLSPRFVEWMMGLPAGYVTDVLGRNAALRVLGNGVVPAQAALAFRTLAAVPPLDRTA